MAKLGLKRGVKTEMIRQYIKGNPDATPQQIAEALTENGLHVSAAHASSIKYGDRAKARKRRTAAKSNGEVGPISVENLVAVRKLAEDFGGVKQLAEVVKMLADLQG